MRDNPINALRETLRCGLAFRKSRLESLCVLVFGVFVARTVNLSHLACHFPGRARSSSNYRRLQRFFEQVDFDYDRLAEFLVAMMGLQAGPWRLTMDRTNSWIPGIELHSSLKRRNALLRPSGLPENLPEYHMRHGQVGIELYGALIFGDRQIVLTRP